MPGVLALLPSYASLEDPVAELRAACLAAVAWLGPGPVEILADQQGRRVAEALLSATSGFETVAAQPPQPTVLVVGNGSARRSEKAPGHFDERAAGFDDALRTWLSSRHVTWPPWGPDEGLLASLDGIRRLPEILPPGVQPQIDYDDDPYGVQYWVMRWET